MKCRFATRDAVLNALKDFVVDSTVSIGKINMIELANVNER